MLGLDHTKSGYQLARIAVLRWKRRRPCVSSFCIVDCLWPGPNSTRATRGAFYSGSQMDQHLPDHLDHIRVDSRLLVSLLSWILFSWYFWLQHCHQAKAYESSCSGNLLYRFIFWILRRDCSHLTPTDLIRHQGTFGIWTVRACNRDIRIVSTVLQSPRIPKTSWAPRYHWIS